MKLEFPEPWYEQDHPDRPLSAVQQIEVRKLPNSPDNEFFFGALPYGDADYNHEWQPDKLPPQYSGNSFAVNLTTPLRVRAASKEEWRSASRIWTKSNLVVSKMGEDGPAELEYHGKRFRFAGKYCSGGDLSPRGQWLAIFSYTGEKTPDLLFGGNSVKFGDVFWQVYDTVTGQMVFEWHANNVQSPTSRRGPVVWLEERYFLFPQDFDALSFSVLTLPEFVPEKNPVTIQLPSRTDDRGQRIPAPVNDEVWTPLIPLSREQAKKITAPQPITLVEVRAPRQSSTKQLLLAIREENANEKRYRGAKGMEEGAEYNFRLFSTYYYAISPDDPTQTRFASKAEWESASRLPTRRGLKPLDGVYETAEGPRRQYRPFPKSGTLGGDALVGTSDWIAILSYTPDSNSSGKMFVDIFEMRPGNKLSTTELPYTGSPVTLFDNAFSVEREYLFLPLNTSLESFVLWKLP